MRVIAATNRDLEEEVRQGRFREDLFYRLNVVPIVLPPLRERPERHPARWSHFYVDRYNSEFRKRVRGVDAAAMRGSQRYGWPGNVRELRNAVERAMLLAEGDELTVDDFPRRRPGRRRGDDGGAAGRAGSISSSWERSLVIQALERSGWNQTKAAALLGVNRDQIRYRIEKFQLEKPSSDRISPRPAAKKSPIQLDRRRPAPEDSLNRQQIQPGGRWHPRCPSE